MYLLSSGETALLNTRFSRILRIGLAVAAVLAVAGTALSMRQDRQETYAHYIDADRYASAATRVFVEQILDQAYYSLMGADADLRTLADQARTTPEDPASLPTDAAIQEQLQRAMRYDPVSRALFFRAGDRVAALDRFDHSVAELLPRLRELPAPPSGHRGMRLLPSVQGADGAQHLPMLLTLPPPFPMGTEVGALVPLAKLRAHAPRPDAGSHYADELLLLDGTILTHSGDEQRYRGRQTVMSLELAQAARRAAQGARVTTSEDGERISAAYDASMRYPFIAVGARDEDVFLGPWRVRSTVKAVLLLAALVSIGWFARSLFRLNRAMAASEEVYRRLFEDVSDAMMLMRADGSIAGLNTSMARLLGLAHSTQAVDRPAYDFYRPTDGTVPDAQRLADVMAGRTLRYALPYRILRTGQVIECDLRLSRIDVGEQPLMLAVVRDISAERRHARQQDYLINHDQLTGLPNRHNLLRVLDRQIAEHPEVQVHLLVINFARFREVNESVGPRTGDTVLEVCAQRLSRMLSERQWQLFRSGGAEFVALGIGERLPALDALRHQIQEVLRDPVPVADTLLEMHARMGAAYFPEDALDASQLLRCAEIAALHARQEVEQWARYTRALDRAPGRDLKLRAELGTAIREGQLRLFFQPKLSLEDRGIAGAEALLRWQHPERGWVPPGEFIPLAENTEIIHPLTRWVLGQAVEQIHAWAAAGNPLPLAVNISVNNLRDPDFTGYVKALLARKGIPPELLELEVTEGALAHDPATVLRRMQELRDAGVKLSLDDFGTGFSGLSYVSQFPFTTIKIDRSFVNALQGGHREREVAKSAITLGRSLGMRTVAEGVEDDETAAALLALECDIGQGWLFGKPMPLADFDAWRTAHEASLTRATDIARRETDKGRKAASPATRP